MPRTPSHSTLAIIYVLGLVWLVAMIGGSAVLTDPMLALYEAYGVESAAMQLAVTMALVMVLASLVTVGVGLVLRMGSEPESATQRR